MSEGDGLEKFALDMLEAAMEPVIRKKHAEIIDGLLSVLNSIEFASEELPVMKLETCRIRSEIACSKIILGALDNNELCEATQYLQVVAESMEAWIAGKRE